MEGGSMEISASLNPAAVAGNIREYVMWLNKFVGTHNLSVHVDVMRRPFVDNDSLTLSEFTWIMGNCKLPMDVHLMIESKDVTQFIVAGKSARSITTHIEIGNVGTKGLAIDLPTIMSPKRLDELRSANVVTIMSVKAGASGQTPNMKKAIDRVKKIKTSTNRIIIDGGVNPDSIQSLKRVGVQTAVVGAALYNAPNREEILKKLLALASKV